MEKLEGDQQTYPRQERRGAHGLLVGAGLGLMDEVRQEV